MATKNPRVMVVLEQPLYKWTKKIAKMNGISLSNVIRDLIRDAYMEYEDQYWAQVGERRLESFDKDKAVSHLKAWGND